MYHIQIPKETAPIQLSKSPNQTIATKKVKAIQEKPAKQNFKSIFTLGCRNSKSVQLMDSEQENSIQLNREEIHGRETPNLAHQQRNETKQKSKIVDNFVIQLFQRTKNQKIVLREKPDYKSKPLLLLLPNTRIKIKKRAEGETDVGEQWEKIEVTTGKGFGKIGWVLKEKIETEEQPETEEVTLKKAQELFDELKKAEFSFGGKKANIPFCYVDAGCYIRAHKMSKLLTKKGYKVEKAFAVAKSGFLRAYSIYTGDVALGKEPVQTWEYHVAPVINVQTGQGVKQYVIDPSLFDKPVHIDEWVERMKYKGQKNDEVKVDLYIASKEHYNSGLEEDILEDDALYKGDKEKLFDYASKERFYIMAAKIRQINSGDSFRDYEQFQFLWNRKNEEFKTLFSQLFPNLLKRFTELQETNQEVFETMAEKMMDIMLSNKSPSDQYDKYKILIEGKSEAFQNLFSQGFPDIFKQVEQLRKVKKALTS